MEVGINRIIDAIKEGFEAGITIALGGLFGAIGEFGQKRKDFIPLRRLGMPDDIAGVVLFLGLILIGLPQWGIYTRNQRNFYDLTSAHL